MNTTFDIFPAVSRRDPSIVTLGNFDGVHLGHQALFKKVIELGAAQHLRTLALFLWPHPREVLTHRRIEPLTRPGQRRRLIKGMGIETCLQLNFTPALAQVSAKTFLQTVKNHFSARILVIGPTTHLGHERSGTPERLKDLGASIGINVHVLEELSLESNVVSSSEIRQRVLDGDVAFACKAMGRPLSVRGRIVSDRGVGKTLGVPTLNLARWQTLLPKVGVYFTRARLGGQSYFSVTNVGYRPSFESKSSLHVETHIIEPFAPQIPATSMRVAFLERFRDEMRFESKEALVAQLRRDIERAQQARLEQKFSLGPDFL